MQIRSGAAVLLAGLAAGCAGASAATHTPAIVFSADRAPALSGEIYRLDASGRRVDLSRSPFLDTQPAVSPDGSHVAFLSDRGGGLGVYEVRIDGTGLTRLATPPLPSTPDDGMIQLAWSPTSRLLALASTTGSVAKLSLIGPGRSAVVAARGRYLFSPAWSSDGRLVIVHGRPDFGRPPEILAFTPAGAPVWRINSGDSFAAWSARGLLKTVDRGSVRVYDERGLARLRFRGRAAAWSPDGTRLASITGGRVEVRTTQGRLVFRKKIRGLWRWPTGLVWAGSRRVVFSTSERTLAVDILTGKASRAASRYFGPRSPDGRFVIQTPRRGSGFALEVTALGPGSSHVYGKVPGCFDDGGFDPAVDYLSLQFVPGRRSLVYQSYCAEPFAALYAIEPDGTGLTRLTHVQEQEADPSWSPDGSRIAYTRYDFTGLSCKGCTGSLTVADADGSHRRRLTAPADPSYADYAPSWSPDGSQIVFARESFTAVELFVVPASGGEPRDLHIAGSEAAWGPSRIAYFDFQHNPATVWTARPDGGDRQQVATAKRDVTPESPDWSRSGTLAFLDGEATAAIVTPTGVQQVHLPFRDVTSLGWSPGGTRFVVTARASTSATYDVYTVRTDGTDPKRLTRDLDASGASWR
jgi:TolB protein